MNGVLEVIAPLRDISTLVLLLRSGSQLVGQSREIVEKHDQIVNERLLQRFTQKIVAIRSKLFMEGIEDTLIDALAAANGV